MGDAVARGAAERAVAQRSGQAKPVAWLEECRLVSDHLGVAPLAAAQQAAPARDVGEADHDRRAGLGQLARSPQRRPRVDQVLQDISCDQAVERRLVGGRAPRNASASDWITRSRCVAAAAA